MRRPDLDELLEMWARWIVNGCNSHGSGFASMLEMMMVTRCQFNGGGGPPSDYLEVSVEAAVMSLTAVDPESATVIRVEYGAWTSKSLDGATTQLARAHAMGITLRSYERRLKKAREYVRAYLKRDK